MSRVDGKDGDPKLRQLAGDAVALRPRTPTQPFSREHGGGEPDGLLEAAVGGAGVPGDQCEARFEGLAGQLLVDGFEGFFELRGGL